ncbi:hypothetical protein ACIBQ1_23200 [Nonomuraea sp. NPDC050153]|uniref:hypothetical protein n=1 Tax=Nonomuraea sp. NPDC050153 TaxID=3364359 RepID=UPI0037AB3E11
MAVPVADGPPQRPRVIDWTNDDQPYRLSVPGMLSVPYSLELNDLGIFTMHGWLTTSDEIAEHYAGTVA